jgi:hypothetical protein
MAYFPVSLCKRTTISRMTSLISISIGSGAFSNNRRIPLMISAAHVASVTIHDAASHASCVLG